MPNYFAGTITSYSNITASGSAGVTFGNTNEIWYNGTTNDTGTLCLSYRGYSGGTSYYRDTLIGDGKGTAIIYIDGSTGYVSIGTGSVGSWRFTVAENRDSDVAAYIYNIHATGYGVKIRGGNTSNYILRLSAYDDTTIADFIKSYLIVYGSIYLNDGNTQIHEGSGNSVRVTTNSGYVLVGPQNASYSHFETDRPAYYFDHNLVINEGIISSYDEDFILKRAGTTKLTFTTTSATFEQTVNSKGDIVAYYV